jgi:transcriptional regulator with XRE-family HTH domain
MIERNVKLEAARRLRGWTLEIASQKIGVHPQTLRKWEMGKSKPHGFRIYKISEVYETTPAALGIGHEYQSFSFKEEDGFALPDVFLPDAVDPQITIDDLDLKLMGLILQRKLERQNLNYYAFQLQIHQHIKEYDEYLSTGPVQNPESPARSQALHIVAAIPITAYLEHIHKQPLPVHPEDILTHCASAITACWHMDQNESLALARSFISGYLMLLSEIFARFVYCQQAAAELIAQTCMLRTMLALQLENSHAGVSYYTKALEFSQIAENSELPLNSSLDSGSLHRYGRQRTQMLKHIAESVWLLKPTPVPPDFPLVHDYLQKLASFYELPLLIEPEKPSLSTIRRNAALRVPEIEHFPTTLDYAATALNLWEGLTFHELDVYAHILDNLHPSETVKSISDAPEEVRLEFLPNRALAALRLHDMNQAITTLRAVIPQAMSMGNEQELVEAREIYHIMQFLLSSDAIHPATNLKDLLQKHD